MNKYIVLINYTPEAIARIIEHRADREASSRAFADAVGGTVEAVYWTLSHYDAIQIIEAPDDVMALASEMAVFSTGLFRHVEVHKILPNAEMSRVLDHAARVREAFIHPTHPESPKH